MKKAFLNKPAVASAVLAALLVLFGCGVSADYEDSKNEGEGNMATVHYSAKGFDKVVIKSAGILYYTAEESDEVDIRMRESLSESFSVTVSDGTLTIDSHEDLSVIFGRDLPKFYVSAPTLSRLEIFGAVEIKEADTITADSFELNVSGAVFGALDLEVKELTASISGVGDLTLDGTAEEAALDVSGAGNLDAYGLDTQRADVTLSGAGDIEISCSDALNAEISGAGDVTYRGDPAVAHTGSGLGKVTKDD